MTKKKKIRKKQTPSKPRLSFTSGHDGRFLFARYGGGEGIVVRNSPVHNVYYARDVSRARRVVNGVQTKRA